MGWLRRRYSEEGNDEIISLTEKGIGRNDFCRENNGEVQIVCAVAYAYNGGLLLSTSYCLPPWVPTTSRSKNT